MGVGAVLKGTLTAATRAIDEMLERPISRLGLTLAESDVLTVVLLGEDQTAAPTDLAELLGLTTAGLTGRLNSLAKRELIERHPHPSDGRRLIVHLTDEGEALARQVLDIKNELLTEIAVSELGEDRARQLIADLTVVLDASRRISPGR